MSIKPTLGDQFGLLLSQIMHHYHTWAKRQDINYNQLAVLWSLSYYHSCTQKQICDGWVLPKQTVSGICKRYMDDGLIEWVSSDDKREKLMSLTEKGKSFAKPIIQRLEQVEMQIFTEFGLERNQHLLGEIAEIERLFHKYMNG